MNRLHQCSKATHPPRHRAKRMAPAAALGALLLAGGVAFAGAGMNVCRGTARAVLISCQSAAHSDHALARGRCLNVGDAQDRRACAAAAAGEKRSAIEDCMDQLEARLEVCEDLGGGPYAPAIDPNDFAGTIDNPLFPLDPGTTYVYETQTAEGLEHNEVFVTHQTRVILGVTCVEVHDTVELNGVLTEDTLDWYAQDTMGNVWYFGENSKSMDAGLVVSLEGSWEAGADGARPGIIMKANPGVGDLYRQEFDLGNAEDLAEVLALDSTATVPFGSFTGLLETRDFTPIEPDANEHKFYAAGIGVVLEVDLETGDRTELVSVTH